MAAAAAGGRPRSARGGSSKTNLAYDLGRKGEPAPPWVHDEPAYADSYEEGVSDRDGAGGTDSGPRRAPQRRSAPKRTEQPTKNADVIPISSAPSAPPSKDTSSSGPFLGQSWPTSVSSGAGKTQGAVIRATGSAGSAVLGAFAYALFINVLGGTGTKWLSAKWTNGDGKLP